MKQRSPIGFLALAILFFAGCQTQEHVVLVSNQDDAAKSPAQAVSQSTRAAATAVLASLTDEQKKLAVYDIKAPLRKDWHFIPRERKGLMLGDMSADQKTLVHKLLQTALSDSGYLKATDIIWLESVLYEMSNKNPMRDPGKYGLVIFGDPSDEKAAWGWRLEGHHLSINLTYTPEGLGATPLFFATNPAVVPIGPLAGKRVLSDAHHLAIELAQSMNDEQRKKMMLGQKPRDVITGPGRERLDSKDLGLASSDMTAAQHSLLSTLIASHLSSFEKKHHDALKLQWSQRRPEQVPYSFVWAGPIDTDKPFYYRIWNDRFVIEYSCQGKNHVHAVVHDLTDPMQEDLLKKHFEQHEH